MAHNRRSMAGFGLIELVIVLAVIVWGLYLVKKIYVRTANESGVKIPRYDEIMKDAKKTISKVAEQRGSADVE
jgi:steroid 5-alpha reductase family enzyme